MLHQKIEKQQSQEYVIDHTVSYLLFFLVIAMIKKHSKGTLDTKLYWRLVVLKDKICYLYSSFLQ